MSERHHDQLARNGRLEHWPIDHDPGQGSTHRAIRERASKLDLQEPDLLGRLGGQNPSGRHVEGVRQLVDVQPRQIAARPLPNTYGQHMSNWKRAFLVLGTLVILAKLIALALWLW